MGNDPPAITEYCARAYIGTTAVYNIHTAHMCIIHTRIHNIIICMYGRVRVHYTKSGLRHKLL